jgi:hypothetical protein
MLKIRRIVSGWFVAVLAVGAVAARAEAQNVVSLTCRSMEVRKAITILQTVSDLRVLVDPKVPSKRITLSFKDLPPEDALRTIVSAAGLSYSKLGNAFVVRSKKPLGQNIEGARAALQGDSVPAVQLGTTPSVGGIVHPNAPAPAPTALTLQPVAVAPEVLAGIERPVDVDVKNGPLTDVMEQLSRSSGLKVTADSKLAGGLVATLALHGIPLKSALELVAGQTGLQISPRPDGVALVTPVLSLDTAQTRTRSTPPGAQRVEQGQLWTAEWANALTSGISAFTNPTPVRSLRRQPAHADGKPVEFKPRSGGPRQFAPPAAPAQEKSVPQKRVGSQPTVKPTAKKPALKKKPINPPPPPVAGTP